MKSFPPPLYNLKAIYECFFVAVGDNTFHFSVFCRNYDDHHVETVCANPQSPIHDEDHLCVQDASSRQGFRADSTTAPPSGEDVPLFSQHLRRPLVHRQFRRRRRLLRSSTLQKISVIPQVR